MRKTVLNVLKSGVQMAASYMVASACIHVVKSIIGIGRLTPENDNDNADEEFGPDLIKRAVEHGVRASMKAQGLSDMAVEMD